MKRVSSNWAGLSQNGVYFVIYIVLIKVENDGKMNVLLLSPWAWGRRSPLPSGSPASGTLWVCPLLDGLFRLCLVVNRVERRAQPRQLSCLLACLL